MAGREPQQWLWVLSEHLEDREIEPVSDADLQAYRDGRLDGTARERIEWALTRNAATRTRLIELAGGVENRSAGAVRDRVLGPAAGDRQRPARRRVPWLIPAAALLLLAITIPIWVWLGSGGGPAGDLERIAFVVRVEGLSDVRSTPDEPSGIPHAVADPETFVTIEVEPQQAVNDKLRFALYRPDGDGLSRIPAETAYELQTSRGAARFRGQAADLVPSTPGTHTIYVVVTTSAPPRTVSGATSDPVGALRQATGGQVYPCSIHIEGEPR